MARGRFISKEIAIDKKVNSLSSPWSMLAFTWLLTHTDGYGRVYGDPAVVRSIVFPRRPDITVDEVEEFIREWNSLGLINWYEVDGEMYIEFPNFSKHQVGLRIEKEGKSNIPPNPDNPVKVPEVPGQNPESGGQNPEKDGKGTPEVEGKLMECEGEFQGEVVVEDGGSSIVNEFSKLYPGLKPTKAGWDDSFRELIGNHITPDIMRRAAQEMAEKGLKVVSPKSLLNPCLIVMQRKNGDQRKRDADGKYAEFINR